MHKFIHNLMFYKQKRHDDQLYGNADAGKNMTLIKRLKSRVLRLIIFSNGNGFRFY